MNTELFKKSLYIFIVWFVPVFILYLICGFVSLNFNIFNWVIFQRTGNGFMARITMLMGLLICFLLSRWFYTEQLNWYQFKNRK